MVDLLREHGPLCSAEIAELLPGPPYSNYQIGMALSHSPLVAREYITGRAGKIARWRIDDSSTQEAGE